MEVWAEDEARIGLQPIIRKVWARKGTGNRPLAHHKTRYEWEYVYGFVRPVTGESEFFLLPSVSNDLMSIACSEFAKARGILDDIGVPKKENTTIIILLIDQAGFHSLKSLKVDEHIIFFPLPPYSPQLQPVECAWPLLHEPIANRNFSSLQDLETTLISRSNYLMSNPNILKGAVGFDWICLAENKRELL